MIKKAYFGAMALGLAAALTPATVQAGMEAKTVTPPVVEEVEESVVSGTLSLGFNTHFISYGADIWSAGSDWKEVLFNPSLELSIDLGGGFSFILGTWWDVNDNAESTIGKYVQEVDVWAGFSYSMDKLTVTLLYQEWMYASASERIVDLKIAYDTMFSPYLLIHGRVDDEHGFDTGIVGVLGGSYGFETGPVSWSIPVAVAFATEDYHGGDGGFAYASGGLTASIPVEFLPGDWTLSANATYYFTDDGVIPNNPDESFVTGTAALTLTF